jgi:hypothetical protein
MILLLQFFLAHIIGDFFLQSNKGIINKEQRKWRSGFLYLHVAIHFLLIIGITANLNLWPEALVISATHLVIDACKLQFQTNETKRGWFFLDQLLHCTVILIVWFFNQNMFVDHTIIADKRLLALVFSILFITRPASFIIKIVISKWSPRATRDIISTEVESLENAGQLIGILERFLILLFIVLDRWEGVGFLLAAKSVFRFGDLTEAKDTKLTEYVLIGTLLSFIIAILTGLMAVFFLRAA